MNSFSAHSLVAPYRLIGFTALSLLIMTTRLTAASIAALMTFSAPITLVWIASNGLYSQDGICLSAAAWNTTSTPCMARWSRAWSRSEEHTSELQSRLHLVCRLLLEKKKEQQSHKLHSITTHD